MELDDLELEIVQNGILTKEALADLVEEYLTFDEFVFDVETMGEHRLDPARNEIFWISLAGPGRADAIPCGHPKGERVLYDEDDEKHRILKNGKYQERRINETSGREKWFPIDEQWTDPPEQLWISDVIDALRPLFFSDRRKVGHNVKFDLESIAKYFGEMPPPPYGDTIVANKLVNENLLQYRLGNCVKREFGFEYDKKVGKEVEKHPYSDAVRYSYLDAKYTWLLWRKLKEGLDREKVRHVFDLEMDLLPVLIDMEMTGCGLDEASLDKLGRDFTKEMADLQVLINNAAGKPVNLNNRTQLAELVYDIRGHECTVFSAKTQQRSTAADSLEVFERRDKVVRAILEHAKISKLQSVFVVGLKRELVDGRVHPNFNQVGAVSGRMSCSHPNVQQIPVRTERGKQVREIFIAGPGNSLIVADLSQIELRVLAHFTKDPMLRKAYKEGLDLHSLTAEAVFGKDFTPTHRSLAKNGNFSIVFGAGPGTLVAKYGFPNERMARRILEGFYDTYRAVEPWQNKVIRDAEQRRTRTRAPFVRTILGRKRRLPGLLSGVPKQRFAAQRQGVSVTISGSAADLFKVAMMDVQDRLDEQGWEGHILMTVHDEIMVEVPEEFEQEGLTLVKDALEGVLNPYTGEPFLSVPIVADAKIVKRWADAK